MEKPTVDLVRVLRVIEYVGPRHLIEEQLINCVKGTAHLGRVMIRAATLGEYPEILGRIERDTEDTPSGGDDTSDSPGPGPDNDGASGAGPSA